VRAGQILGIRPEHLDLAPDGWTLKAETMELLGAERLVHARLGDEALTVRLDEAQAAPAPGESFCVRPRADRLHFFDAGTTMRVSA
jgi:sn-glycerol 3-phosphate transport system ATP-binding protein